MKGTNLSDWHDRLATIKGDAELRRLSPGLDLTVCFQDRDGHAIGLLIKEGELHLTPPDAAAAVVVTASDDAWGHCLKQPAPPTFHAFTAWELANPHFSVSGDPRARAEGRAALERIVEAALAHQAGDTRPLPRDVSQITGQLRQIAFDDGTCDLFFETVGDGTPVLFLHTAGADSRQFRAQLANPELAARFRMIAPDMPFHGRTLPPSDWEGAPYHLNMARYAGWCRDILEQIVGEPAIVAGGSMGAAIALVLAAHHPELLHGVVAIEPPFRSRGRGLPWQDHVGVHGGLHNGAFVRGLMSPLSPEANRRAASWIYAQGAPGVYPGDLAFYSDEFDGGQIAPLIDAGSLPVALLSGGYDYSATPADGAELADRMPGARHIVMDGLGHFPMCENPALFHPYLLSALEFVMEQSKDEN